MDYDIIIVGGGPAGLSFACSVAETNLKIAIIEKQTEDLLADPGFDGRDIALTHSSVEILNNLGAWARIPAEEISPIQEAKVVNGDSPYSLDFDTARESIDALGYLVSNHLIRRALYEESSNYDNIDIITDTIVTSVNTGDTSSTVTLDDDRVFNSTLVVAADSRFSETRRMVGIQASMFDFGRICIVCRMEHEESHDHTAFECFHYGRTLAILPLNGNKSSVVVTAPMSDRDIIMDMQDDEFNLDIQNRFEKKLGEMRLITERFAYPLVGVHAKKFFTNRFALIGDAAVGMHPVTAHGFNLGLSGQEILAKEVIKAVDQQRDIGDYNLLERFNSRHMRTTLPIYHGTNEIVKMFTDDRPPAKMLRRLTLRFANNFPPIKHVIRNKLTESKNSPGFLPSLFS